MGTLITIGIRVLEVLFVLGAIGSALVLLLSGIEDGKMLFEKEPGPSSSETEA